MAFKKTKYSDLFEKKLFDPAIEGAEKLLKQIKELEDGFKDLLKETADYSKTAGKIFDDVETLNKREKAINDNADAVRNLDKLERDRIKLEERLKNATDKRAEANAALRVQIQERNKENKEAARIAGNVGPYKQLSATLNKLRNEYKDLAAAGQENTKEAKKLLKEVQDLDEQLKELDSSVGQNQRRVGSYKQAVSQLRGELKLLGRVAVVAVLGKFVQTLQNSEEGAKALQKGLLQLTVRLNVFVAALTEVFREGLTVGNIFERFEKAFEGFNEKVNKSIELNEKAVDTSFKARREAANYRLEIAELAEEQARLQVKAGDATISLSEQRKALKALNETEEQIATLRVKIANAEARAIRKKVKASREERGERGADIKLLEQLADAEQAVADAEAERAQLRAERARRGREIASDEAEQELDILIDAADNLKSVRERQISDETLNLAERRELLRLTEKDLEDSFQRQIAVLQQFTEEGKRIDAPTLIGETDTKALNDRVKALGLSEVLQTRLLEVIRDRRSAQEDLRESNRDLAKSETEYQEALSDTELLAQALKEVQEEGAVLSEVLARLEERRLEQQISATRKRLNAAEEGSNERIEIQKELNELLLQQEAEALRKRIAAAEEGSKKRIELEKKLKSLLAGVGSAKNDDAEDDNEERLRKEREFAEALISLTKEYTRQRLETQREAIDKEIEASEERQRALRRISEAGQADAEDALAFEERKAAELEREKRKQARRTARIELALSALQTYSNKVAAGEESPLTSTISDIGLLQAFIASLPAFYEGTENVAQSLGKPHLNTNKDGYIIRVDGNEKIFNPQDSALIPKGMSNFEAAVAARQAYYSRPASTAQTQGGINQQALEQSFEKAVSKIEVYKGRDYDPTERAIIDTYERRGKRIKKHYKTGSIWG